MHVRLTGWRNVRTLAAIAAGIAGVAGTAIKTEAKANGGREQPSVEALAACTTTNAILQIPTGIIQSKTGNLLVAESGTATPNSGRISIVDLSGSRRTLVAGLPSGISDVGAPNGPSGLFMRGRTLYVAIGSGNVGRNGPIPGTSVPNPTEPPSSPIFSSVLAIHLSNRAEQATGGFALTLADHLTVAGGQSVRLSNGNQHITVELVAKLPNFTAKPLTTFPASVHLTNPFALVEVRNQLYVTDGGQNAVWRIDIRTGAFWKLTEFSDIPNPLFPAVGGPIEEAVPTGIAYARGRLLITLFSGAPFAPGTSSVQQVYLNGSQAPFLTGLKTAIGVLAIDGEDEDDEADDRRNRDDDSPQYLVLENASVGPFFNGPGPVLGFAEQPAADGARQLLDAADGDDLRPENAHTLCDGSRRTPGRDSPTLVGTPHDAGNRRRS
jgi:hypothetical protein